ncbi:hypothetical protein [uncultured Christiangramia sp.]|uniref:hypothetical protein n=1 Tax=uncultured Christiangramia sp. TaxID=503836 RepID=UPI002627D3C3|nr:hypothetical protein [uncultured Christiangramia sp.]
MVYCPGEVGSILQIQCDDLKIDEFRTLVFQEDIQVFEDLIGSVLNRGETKNIELRIHVSNSGFKWLNIIVSPLMDGNKLLVVKELYRI